MKTENTQTSLNKDKKIQISKSDRVNVSFRSWFLQGSWNYERMQNGGWAFSLIPVLKKLYPGKEEAKLALKRHLEFFNTHPYVVAPILGVTLALEEQKANGTNIDDATIQGVKIGMMGPLAGIGDPVFWFTIRPILGAIAASLAFSGSLIAPLFFFIVWNVIRISCLWYTQELGYRQGVNITQNLSGNLLSNITKGASILGMFVMGVLVTRWTTINFAPIISKVKLQAGAFIDWSKFDKIDGATLKGILNDLANGISINQEKITTLQDNLNQLVPGFAAVLLTFICMWLLNKKISPIIIIFSLFGIGILGHIVGLF